MATNLKATLASTIAATKKQIDTLGVTLKSLTTSLVAEVGEDGETFTTELGDVQVTQQTYDRASPDLSIVFDQNVYLGLDRRTQNRLQALGLVKVAPKMISGQAPKVVVRLK
jgi:hypothetical protein